MATDTEIQRPHARRGMGSVIALLLLAIASIVIVGVATPAADRAEQSRATADALRAALAVDAGISVLAAADGSGRTPAIPPTLASNYPVTFVRLQSEGASIRYRVEATFAGATRTVDVAHQPQPSGTDVATSEWTDQPPYADYTAYTP